MNVYAGPAREMTWLTLRLVPLTPVHIGDGTEWRPDEYLIDEPKSRASSEDEDDAPAASGPPRLCRFGQTAAIRAMTPAERSAFVRALDAAKLDDAAKALRDAGRRCILERIPVSRASASELRQAMNNPRARTGQVKPFVRSGGRPYIPGSSIKGALRTALASSALPRSARPADGWRHEDAMQEAFGLDPHDTSTDPLRFLHVADAFLPEGATLIDKTEVMKRSGEAATAPGGGGGIQMHYERTRALTDGADAPVFEVAVSADHRASAPGCVGRDKASFDARSVISRSRAFHAKLFNTEMGRFFEGATTSQLLDLLRKHASPEGVPPTNPQGWSPGFVLLRLGRFGHFESKSLEGVRRGHVPQAKPPQQKIRQPDEWGSTRTVTRDAKGNPIPFGWVIGWILKEDRA